MTEAIPSPPVAEAPFNLEFQRNYLTDGHRRRGLEVFESEFVLDAQNRIARFRVMGNRTELEQEIASFERRLFTYLSLFGVGMIAINAMAILLGLRPLGRVRECAGDGARGHGAAARRPLSRPRSSRSPTRPTR